MSIVVPILLFGAHPFTPNMGSFTRLNAFWHKVQRWATNCFSSTPIGILAIESCLPPIPLLVSNRQRLAALRTVCSPPSVNPATACLHPSFPSLSSYPAPEGSRTHTRGLSSVYLLLSWKPPSPSPRLRNPLPIDAVAHRTIAFTGGLSRVPIINMHLVQAVSPSRPLPSLMESTCSGLKKWVSEVLIEDWSRLPPPPLLLSSPPSHPPSPVYGSGHVRGRANPPNQGWEKLRGSTPLLEGP